MTEEQQRALALARARQRASQATEQPAQPAGLDVAQFRRDQMAENISPAKSATLGAMQGATFGASDEGIGFFRGVKNAATNWNEGRGSVLDPDPGFFGRMQNRFGQGYVEGRDEAREALDVAREEHPVAAYGGEVAGGVATALTGLGALGQATTRGGQYVRAAGVGSTQGSVYGFNTGEGGAQNRLGSGRHGAALGAGAGIVSVPLGAALAHGTKAGGSAFQALIGRGQPQRAQRAISKVLNRSGRSGDEVATALRQAAREGQSEFAVVDALGRPGQRMLSGVARSTPDVAQEIQDTLMSRQAGQAGRTSSFLAEAFNAPQSAAATQTAMKAARGQAANINYAAAADGAGPVDIRPALAVIDDRIGGMQGSGVRGDGIDARLATFRDRLAAAAPERSQFGASAVELSDFNRVLGVKQDVQDAIGAAKRAGRNNEARELKSLVTALDEALERSSAGYRRANDAFAAASREIGQIDAGKRAAGPRARAEDTLAAYGQLTPGQQAAFRVGYVDPHIARIERGAVGANAARPLTSQKFQQEAAGMATDPQLLARRLGRENTMFETNSVALGGSRTADNLADTADVSSANISALAQLLRGHIISGGGQLAGAAFNRMRGQGPGVRSEIGRMLSQSGDSGADVIRQLLTNRQLDQAARLRLIDKLIAMGGTGSGMAVGP